MGWSHVCAWYHARRGAREDGHRGEAGGFIGVGYNAVLSGLKTWVVAVCSLSVEDWRDFRPVKAKYLTGQGEGIKRVVGGRSGSESLAFTFLSFLTLNNSSAIAATKARSVGGL